MKSNQDIRQLILSWAGGGGREGGREGGGTMRQRCIRAPFKPWFIKPLAYFQLNGEVKVFPDLTTLCGDNTDG